MTFQTSAGCFEVADLIFTRFVATGAGYSAERLSGALRWSSSQHPQGLLKCEALGAKIAFTSNKIPGIGHGTFRMKIALL